MLRKFLPVIWLVIGTHFAVADPGKAAIKDTIQGQINAFQADDFAAAFAFASPTIKRIFGNHANFGQMVKQGFPMVWRPDSVTYLEQSEAGGQVLQKVLIRDRAGAIHVLEYQMIKTADGWQINGVLILRQPGVGV